MDPWIALRALGELLESRGEPHDLAIVGGSALVMLGAIDRATQDVDVVGSISEGQIRSATPLSTALAEAVRDIAALLRIPQDWLNPGPTQLLDLGLPEGFLARTETLTFGALTCRIASRLDQIHFKLYAATDQGVTSKHEQDLRALRPTIDELAMAATWCATHDPSPGFAALLAVTVERHRAE